MARLAVVHLFVISIVFNMMLPTSDVYSDIILMFQTWNFQNTDSLEMSGCRACYGKTEQDLYRNDKDCGTCITENVNFYCGRYFSSINKLSEFENKDNCVNEKWVVHNNGSLEKGECDLNRLGHLCCFETTNNSYKSKNQDDAKLKFLQLNPKFLVQCDTQGSMDVSKNFPYDIHTCSLTGKTDVIKTGFYCSVDIVYQNRKQIKTFLETNMKNFTKTNFTGMALKFLLNNDSSSDISAIVPVDIDNLNKDENFECGILIKPKSVNIIGDTIGVDCGMDTCRIHLDSLHYHIDGMHDLQSWQTKITFHLFKPLRCSICYSI